MRELTYIRGDGVIVKLTGGDLDGDGNTDRMHEEIFIGPDAPGSDGLMIRLERFFDSAGNEVDRQVLDVRDDGRAIAGGEIGSAFGSALGHAIGGDNLFAGLAASTLIGTIGKNLGQMLHRGVQLSLLEYQDIGGVVASPWETAQRLAFADFGVDLKNAAYGNVTGALSSFLMGELAENLGLEGMGAGVFTTAGNAVANQLFSNLGMMAGILEVPSGYQALLDANGVFAGFDTNAFAGNLQGAFGAYFGSELAGSLIRADNHESALFASAATAVGSAIGTAVGVALAWIPVVGPFIGAFLGRLVGTWAGNALFDDDSLAGATVGYDPSTDSFRIVDGRVWDGGDFTLAQAMADNVIETLNSVLAATGSQVNEGSPPGTVEVGYYTNYRGWTYVFADGLQEYYRSRHGTIDEALTHAAVYATEKMVASVSLQGGDPMLVRAFEASKHKGLAQLGLDLKVAQDYARYLENVGLINALIAAEPTSEFSAGWIVTLQRAQELGLDDPFHASGVYGNGNSWASTTQNGRVTARTYADANGDEAWATIAEAFDRYGEVTGRTVLNDDGSRQVDTFDPWDTFLFKTLTEAHDASGALVSRTATADAGAVEIVTYDPHGCQSWAEIRESRNAAGATLSKAYLQDDGRQVVYDYDRAGQAWQEVTRWLDAKGRLYGRVEALDDGTTITHAYAVGDGSRDPALSRITYAYLGGSGVGYEYDPGNAQAWSRVVTYWNAAGLATTVDYDMDDARAGRRRSPTTTARGPEPTATSTTTGARWWREGRGRIPRGFRRSSRHTWSLDPTGSPRVRGLRGGRRAPAGLRRAEGSVPPPSGRRRRRRVPSTRP